MLCIKNLSVELNGKGIIHNINLTVPKGEIHALMGPNGSGKSTLAKSLAGDPTYLVSNGRIELESADISDSSAESRAQKGLFIGFQNPIEIPGVGNSYFIRSALNAIRRSNHQPEIDASDFLKLIKDKIKDLNLPESLLQRGVNQGFSGGEKKCNEILQMLILEPKLIILDEIDSGLDIDTLKRVADIIIGFKDINRSFLLITHYPRLLEYISVDKIHIIQNGNITHTGDKTLLSQLEKKGYMGLKIDPKEAADG